MLHVEGCPIDGENPPHEQRWRAAIAAAATGTEPAAAVQLHFRIEPHRKVDLDNLVRPALAGLRDAGVFTRGYRSLDAILATKTPADEGVGVHIHLANAAIVAGEDQPARIAMAVAHTALPRDGDRGRKHDWRETVRRQQVMIDDGAVWLDIAVNTSLSLEGYSSRSSTVSILFWASIRLRAWSSRPTTTESSGSGSTATRTSPARSFSRLADSPLDAETKTEPSGCRGSRNPVTRREDHRVSHGSGA